MNGPRGSRFDTGSVRLAIRLFAIMHRLLPGWYRRRHGDDAVALFADLASEAHRDRGLPGLLSVFAASAVDLIRRAPSQHASLREQQRPGNWLSGWNGGLRQTVRGLARKPVHSLAVVLTLALATGATTTMVGVADAVLFRPLPYADPGGLYRLVGTYSGDRAGAVSFPDWVDVRDGTDVFSTMSLHSSWSATLTDSGDPAIEAGLRVTSTFFDVVGLEPSRGRFFLPEEDLDGRQNVVVLGYGLWQRRFGGDPSIIGRTLMMDGSAYEVVGVGPASLPDALPAVGQAALYRPFGWESSPNAPSRGNESWNALVRLREGVTPAQADAAVAAVMADIERSFPDTNAGQSMRLEPVREQAVVDARPALLVFIGMVGVVLAIAIVNVVNLMLARSADRRRELAMRSALGASRGRIARQQIVEAMLLSAGGGLAGWLIALYGTRLLVRIGAGAIPLAQTVTMDERVLAVSMVVCVVAGLITGIAAGWYASAGDPARVLVETGGGRGSTGGRATSRIRRGLVAAQVAMCVLLVITASLFVRSLDRLVRVEPGFDTSLISMRLAPPAGTYPEDDDIQAFYRAVVERTRAIPGVIAVATAGATPLSGTQVCGTLFAEEDPHRFDGQDMCAEVRPVSPEYFDVMGIPLPAGRPFTAADDSTSPYVGIVSRTTADLLWSGADPVGRRFQTGLRTYHEVVGLAADVKQFSLDESTPPQTYLPEEQWVVRGRTVVLRAGVTPESLYPALRDAVWSVDELMPIRALGTLRDDVDRTTRTPRFRTMLITAFALLAVVLALVGLYGVIAGAVASRRAELAIRLSLGARRSGLLAGVLAEGGRLAAAGIAVGLVAAFGLTSLVANLLFGVTAHDPVAFALAPVLVLACALIANLVPALRATRVDPAETLRME